MNVKCVNVGIYSYIRSMRECALKCVESSCLTRCTWGGEWRRARERRGQCGRACARQVQPPEAVARARARSGARGGRSASTRASARIGTRTRSASRTGATRAPDLHAPHVHLNDVQWPLRVSMLAVKRELSAIVVWYWSFRETTRWSSEVYSEVHWKRREGQQLMEKGTGITLYSVQYTVQSTETPVISKFAKKRNDGIRRRIKAGLKKHLLLFISANSSTKTVFKKYHLIMNFKVIDLMSNSFVQCSNYYNCKND